LGPLPDAAPNPARVEAAFEAFTAWAADQGLDLYPHQEDALLALAAGEHVILGTPTGSGKSLVAAGAHTLALAQGQRSCYTAPIKALVSEKFFDLIGLFGPANVGLMTGDAAVNQDAPIICCTAEILANLALRHGPATPFATVIMDEFHFYGDPQRGWAWQVPLLEMPNTQFLLMSATLGDVSFFVQDLRQRTGRPVAAITNAPRPIPLTYDYQTMALPELVTGLKNTGQTPAYLVHFTQREAVEWAGQMLSLPLASKEQQEAIKRELAGFRFGPGFGATLSKLLKKGIGVHHAGLLPAYRRLVERLAGLGLLTVISGTDTLGVGINVPIKTVVITSLVKFDGHRLRRLNAREFHQVAGRAGRAGFDDAGLVMVQAPEHAIIAAKAQAKAQAKAEQGGKKPRTPSAAKPEKGKISWSVQTFERLRDADPEPLTSHLRVTHSMLLQLLARPDGDPVTDTYRLLTDNHEPVRPRNPLLRDACRIYRSLKAGGVITHREGQVHLEVDLPEDFALNQPLTPFALAALEGLDPASDTYQLDVVSTFEATLETPTAIVVAQEKAAKAVAIAQMKADGWDYLERMQALDQVTYPKPLEEFLTQALAVYRRDHPWVADFELAPKSILREMREVGDTFPQYIARYGLARSEGLLLRYLADAHRTLTRSAPLEVRAALVDLTDWLGDLIRDVDSSLLDEWEELMSLGEEEG
jgi:superfamily II RNA helicase